MDETRTGKKKMTVACVFDNPQTLARELWRDGRFVKPIPCGISDIGAAFKHGFVYGDSSALNQSAYNLHKKWRKLL